MRLKTEYSASRKLLSKPLSCMLKTPYLSGTGVYKLQFMYMLLEYSTPMKTQCIVASQPMWPPAPPGKEAISQRATCEEKEVTGFRWEHKADTIEAFHANRK